MSFFKFLFPWFRRRCCHDIVNIKNYGAVGDGIADEYDAIHKAVAVINRQKGGILFFPQGIYKIDRYKIESNPDYGKDILFKNCNGLKIIGYGAKVEVKGKIYRKADYQSNAKKWYSNSNSIIPFKLVACSNFSIEGFEIDGNVDQMTRDLEKDVVEGPGHGIWTSGCSNYSISNIHVHHFSADGLAIGVGSEQDKIGGIEQHRPDFNVRLTNIKSANNARGALSIFQAVGVSCNNCQLLFSGISEGSYGGHSPQHGIDIEPDFDLEQKTEYITFSNCEIRGNIGIQFSASSLTQNIYIDKCRIIGEQDSGKWMMFFSGKNTNLTSSFIDDTQIVEDPADKSFGGGIHATWSEGSSTKIIDCEIRSKFFGVTSERREYLTIQRCRIIGVFSEGDRPQYLPYLRNSKCRFIDNYIFRPSAAYKTPSPGLNLNWAFIEVQHSEGNLFDTDLIPKTNEHFHTSYGTPETSVENDRYIAKEEQAFRIFLNSTWDNSLPYSQGLNNLGGAIIGGKKHAFGTVAPTSGIWQQGDIVYNTNPIAGSNIGWVCVDDGEPKIWKKFGTIEA